MAYLPEKLAKQVMWGGIYIHAYEMSSVLLGRVLFNPTQPSIGLRAVRSIKQCLCIVVWLPYREPSSVYTGCQAGTDCVPPRNRRGVKATRAAVADSECGSKPTGLDQALSVPANGYARVDLLI